MTSEIAWVALLRGINVGGRHALPMTELAALFQGAGAREVTTYIQSGNVIFRATAQVAAKVPAAAAAAIRERWGFESPVLLRSAPELRAVIEGNPFLAAGENPDFLHVAFLPKAPAPDRAAALDPKRSPGDRFAVLGREVYLCCPKGYGQTKLTPQWLDGKLATVSTVRNWRTTRKLLELAGG
ncbi:MAG: DUF1697 domain-containing protein [Myxococcales bacterium]